MQKSMRKLNTFDPNSLWKLFDTQITPILTYSSAVWGLEHVDRIEKVHTFAIKRFLNVPLHPQTDWFMERPLGIRYLLEQL